MLHGWYGSLLENIGRCSHIGEQAAEMTKGPEVVVGKAEIAPKRRCKASARRGARPPTLVHVPN